MKILVKAYLSGNLGDDLMLSILCNRYPKHTFYVVGHSKYKNAFKDIKNLTYICSNSFFNRIIYLYHRIFLRDGKDCINCISSYMIFDQYIIIGGSMFIENDNYKVKMLSDDLWLQKKPYIIGFNFGPYIHSEFLQFYKQKFAKCYGLTTRDMFTFKLFDSLPNITYAPDLVFLTGTQFLDYKPSKEIFISVVGVNRINMSEDQYIDLFVNISQEVNRQGFIPLFVSFCKAEGDEFIIKKICQKINVKYRVLYYNGSNLKGIIQRLYSSQGVIAGRFHAMILSLLYNKRFIPLIYSPKMLTVLKDMQFNGYYHVLDTQNILDIQQLSVLWNKEPFFTISKTYVDNADRQFIYLDNILGKNYLK